ncbi:MAG: DUF4194 domain-containing protein [Opitutus sp.]
MNQRPDWQHTAVHLLQGPVFEHEAERWRRMTTSKNDLAGYFSQIGLRLVVDSSEGYAYLEQLPDEELGDMPRIVKRRQLSLQATVYGFFLRQELDRVLKEDPANLRVRILLSSARELVAEFFPATNNDTGDRQGAMKHLGELADLGFVRKVSEPGEEPLFELTRLLRAKFNPAAADEMLSRIRNHIERRNGNATPGRSRTEDETAAEPAP